MHDGFPPDRPTMAELVELLAAARERVAPAAAETNAGKWLLGVLAALLVTFLGGLGTYAGSTIAGVGTLGPKIDGLKGSLDELKTNVAAISQQSQQQQIVLVRQDVRLSTLEQAQAGLADRVRAVEGRTPSASERTTHAPDR